MQYRYPYPSKIIERSLQVYKIETCFEYQGYKYVVTDIVSYYDSFGGEKNYTNDMVIEIKPIDSKPENNPMFLSYFTTASQRAAEIIENNGILSGKYWNIIYA